MQRAGLLVIACTCLLLSVVFGSTAVEEHFENGTSIALLWAVFFTLIAIRFIRNAFLRSKEPESVMDNHEDD